jgi:hypothetical protein
MTGTSHVIVGMKHPKRHFVSPGLVARAVNRLYGWLTSLGLGPSYSYLLVTKGRKTGITYSTPVNGSPLRGETVLDRNPRPHPMVTQCYRGWNGDA